MGGDKEIETLPLSVTRCEPSREKDSVRITPPGVKVLQQDPVPAFQSRTVLSNDADATNWLSGEKATVATHSKWPWSVLRQDPVPASQSRTVLSSDADAISWPSGEKATALTKLKWPSNVCNKASQSFCIFGKLVTHIGIWSLNVVRIILISGAKMRVEE